MCLPSVFQTLCVHACASMRDKKQRVVTMKVDLTPLHTAALNLVCVSSSHSELPVSLTLEPTRETLVRVCDGEIVAVLIWSRCWVGASAFAPE